MNRKPLWGLWLLMIVAPVAVFFGVRYWKQLPPPLSPQALEMAAQGTPLIGELQIVTVQGKPTSYGTMIQLCNPTREKLSVAFLWKAVPRNYSNILKVPLQSSVMEVHWELTPPEMASCILELWTSIETAQSRSASS